VLASGIMIPLASSQHNLYVLLCVQCNTPNNGQRNRPKHVEFYSKNEFEKLVHHFGFIIRVRIYHDARSSECQIQKPTRYLMGTADGGTVVKELRYKSEGRWFDSRWCHWNFSLT
jgi:hypothetical protein